MLKRPQAGATLVEFQVIGLLCLLPLLLGLLQLALLLLASPLLHYATFQAVRAGTLAGADPAVMRRALAVGLMPLQVEGGTTLSASNAPGVAAAAAARSMADVLVFARITLMQPSTAAFEDFSVDTAQGRAIPNGSLLQRTAVPGLRSGLSIQQANVLQVRVDWCAPLVVPLIDRLLVGVLRGLDADLHSQVCYAAGRVPLRASAALNMQSDVRFHGD